MIKKTRLSIVALGLLATATGGVAFSENTLVANGEESSPLLVTELFAPSGILLEPISQDPNMENLDKGLLLTSTNAKNTLAWGDSCVGEFSFSYMPLRTGNAYDAKALEVTFTDEVDGDNFTIVIEHGETMNAYVRFQNISAGIYYVNQKQLDFTSFCNEDGAYTQFSTQKISVRFDPSTMCVYAGDEDSTLWLVWDLSKEINDGRDVDASFTPMENYTVSFAMPSFALRSGSVLLYEVNGCALNDLFVR